jgi:hypothetical protein
MVRCVISSSCTYSYAAGGFGCFPRGGVPSGLLGLYEEPAPLAPPLPFSAPLATAAGARAAPRLLGMYVGFLVLPPSSPHARPAAVSHMYTHWLLRGEDWLRGDFRGQE